jgi:hypothetical protein
MKAKPLRFALALLVQTICLSGCETKQQAAPGPPPVEFIEVIQKDVPVSKEWVATLDGLRTVRDMTSLSSPRMWIPS